MYRRLWLIVVFGCEPPALTDEPLPPPCADGGWGAIGDPADTIDVQPGGDDTNDGSAEAPLLTLSAALDAARNGTPRIGVGAGTFEATLDLVESDAGLEIVGCSPDETILVPDVEGEPQIKVTAAVDITIASLTLSGGDRGLWVWGGAESQRLPRGDRRRSVVGVRGRRAVHPPRFGGRVGRRDPIGRRGRRVRRRD